MHVLHAALIDPAAGLGSGVKGLPCGLAVWAEAADRPPPERHDRRVRRARPHPFAADSAALRRLARTHLGGALPASAKTRTVDLWLPTAAYGPLPSPALAHDWDQDVGACDLRPWTVPAIVMPLPFALRWLGGLPEPEALSVLLRLGDDVRLWQSAARLASELAAGQQAYPVLVQVQSGFEARWFAVLDGPTVAPRLAQLAAAMPAACRAAATDPASAPAPANVIQNFFHQAIDQHFRASGSAVAGRAGARDLAEAAWLAALVAVEPAVKGPPAPVAHLAHGLRAWLRNLTMAGTGAFRVAFRLTAPSTPAASQSNEWSLEFMLQSRSDPTLLVPAGEVWAGGDAVATAFGGQLGAAREQLLGGLGHTVRWFPPLERALSSARPERLACTTDESHAFLRQCAPLLEAAGFGLQVPTWWGKTRSRLAVRVSVGGATAPPDDADGHLGLDRLLDYRWEIAVGDTVLSREEFEALVALKAPLVAVRGEWVELDPAQVAAAVQFWERLPPEGALTLGAALHMSLDEQSELHALPVAGVDWNGWLADLAGDLVAEEAVLPVPNGLRATLRPYQQRGYAWLDARRRHGLGAVLADDMGLGKTIQTLAAILRLKEADALPGPVLLICPTSVVTNWAREAERFTPALSTWIHQGPLRLKGAAFQAKAEATDMVLTSYALLRRDVELVGRVAWYGVVIDEAQNVKNPGTRQAMALRGIPAAFRLALTGTPVENRLSELWSIMEFLNPGYLGPLATFRRELSLPIERDNDPVAAGRLRRLIGPFILRRVKTDKAVIADLPDKVEAHVYCQLTGEQATLYEAVVKNALEEIEASEGIARRGLVLRLLMQLKQVCNHPAQFMHQGGGPGDPVDMVARSGKLARLVEIVEEALAADGRLLIFTQFTEMGELLVATLRAVFGQPVLYLHGGIPPARRDDLVRRFQDDPDGPRLFILSLKAGGTGLNLTRANHVVHFDRWWNPAVEDQATDRAFRIGQTRNVLVHKFLCVGTLEEQIDEMIERKKALAALTVGAGEAWLTELSTDALRDLVTLRREALA